MSSLNLISSSDAAGSPFTALPGILLYPNKPSLSINIQVFDPYEIA